MILHFDLTVQRPRYYNHKELIEAIVNEVRGAASHGFNAMLGDALREHHRLTPMVGYLVPDAFVFNELDQTIVLYEVEDRHPLKTDKLEKYQALKRNLSRLGWQISLFVVTRWGVCFEVDIHPHTQATSLPRNFRTEAMTS